VIRIHLSDRDADRLEQAFLQAADRKLRDRLQIVRLAHRSRPHQDIAADLGVPPAPSSGGSTPTWDRASTA
jgi:hypothetical protein